MNTNQQNATTVLNIATIKPSTTKAGMLVSYTDKRGRACVGYIVNVFPGMIVVSVRACEGVEKRALCTFHPVMLPWPGRKCYRGDFSDAP